MEDTKAEYVKHLCDLISIPLSKRFLSMKQECGLGRLKDFQKRLTLIQKWTSLELKKEVDDLLSVIKCDYIHQLVREIITLNIKIKIADYKDSISKIKVKIPTIEDFFHMCFVKCAENFWKNPHLFYENIKDIEKQQCFNMIEKLTKNAVSNALRSFTPVQEIMKKIAEVSQNGLVDHSNTEDDQDQDNDNEEDGDEEDEEDGDGDDEDGEDQDEEDEEDEDEDGEDDEEEGDEGDVEDDEVGDVEDGDGEDDEVGDGDREDVEDGDVKRVEGEDTTVKSVDENQDEIIIDNDDDEADEADEDDLVEADDTDQVEKTNTDDEQDQDQDDDDNTGSDGLSGGDDDQDIKEVIINDRFF